jgi:hypothetical protein
MVGFTEVPQIEALSVAADLYPSGQKAILSVVGSQPVVIHLERAALIALQRRINELLAQPLPDAPQN